MPNPKGINQYTKGGGKGLASAASRLGPKSRAAALAAGGGAAPQVKKVSDRGSNPGVTAGGRIPKPKTAVGGGALNAKGFRKAPISAKQLAKNDAAMKRGTNPGVTR